MTKRDLNELYAEVQRLRDEFDVILSVWSIEDVEMVVQERYTELTPTEVQQRAEAVWPIVKQGWSEITAYAGYEVIEGVLNDIEEGL